jgi:hypothetical protein
VAVPVDVLVDVLVAVVVIGASRSLTRHDAERFVSPNRPGWVISARW